MSIDKPHDERLTRCPMLGHDVSFAYCRQTGSSMPCHKILDCWFEVFPVADFVREHYSTEQIQRIFAPPKPKMTSLVELIQQAQKNIKPPDNQ